MAATYSIDLRRKILAAHERQAGSQRAIAEFFGVSRSFVEKLLQRYRQTGDIAPKARAATRSTRRLDQTERELVCQWLQAQPDLTLSELAQRLAQVCGIQASLATLCRVLQQLDLPRKKSRSMPASATPSTRSGRAATTEEKLPAAP
jgi:transposase